MIKTKIIIGVLFISIFHIINAQNISISPYSGIGAGDNLGGGETVLASMGGTSTAYINRIGNEVNFGNPAANQNIYYTIFNIDFNTSLVNFKGTNINENQSITYLTNVSLAFPVSEKVKLGLGYQPITGTGYNIRTENTVTSPNISNKYEGTGGLNSLHAMVSYNVNKKLSFGARLNYIFGTVDKFQEVYVQDGNLFSGEEEITENKSFKVLLGAAYALKIGDTKHLDFGLTYNLPTNIGADTDYLYSTYYYTSNGIQAGIDTINYVHEKKLYKNPNVINFGINYSKDLKWSIGAEFDWSQKAEYGISNLDVDFLNNYRFAVGGWYIPNINSPRNYLNRITYRYGLYYQSAPYKVNGTDINAYGLTVGFGFPINKKGNSAPSMINLGLEIGQRGSTDNGLIRENYGKIKIGLNFNDKWFKKRVFD